VQAASQAVINTMQEDTFFQLNVIFNFSLREFLVGQRR
jgi:hypothetical protein